jgi:hypothetical protein
MASPDNHAPQIKTSSKPARPAVRLRRETNLMATKRVVMVWTVMAYAGIHSRLVWSWWGSSKFVPGENDMVDLAFLQRRGALEQMPSLSL